jgi:hypothetical protein
LGDLKMTTHNVALITPETRTRVTEIISAGLVTGLGKPVPGQMCLEAAICLAFGEPHSDEPRCVAVPDRKFAIRLQDAYPGTPEERAALFLPLGLAQLGTAGTDRRPWVKLVAEGTIRKIVPIYLRRAAEKQAPASAHHASLLAAADRCEAKGTEEAARAARKIAAAAAAAADAAAAAYAAADAAYAAADAAAAAADAAAAAAAYADAAAYASLRRQAIEISVSIALEAYKAEGRS